MPNRYVLAPLLSPDFKISLTRKQKAKAAARKTVPTTPTKPKAKVQARSVSESESESEDEEGYEEEHETPSRKTPLATPMKSPVKTPRSRQKPRSQTIEFALLGKFNEGDKAAETPIVDVSVGNEEQQAEAKKKGGGFEKLVKLDSANKFEVLKTVSYIEESGLLRGTNYISSSCSQKGPMRAVR